MIRTKWMIIMAMLTVTTMLGCGRTAPLSSAAPDPNPVLPAAPTPSTDLDADKQREAEEAIQKYKQLLAQCLGSSQSLNTGEISALFPSNYSKEFFRGATSAPSSLNIPPTCKSASDQSRVVADLNDRFKAFEQQQYMSWLGLAHYLAELKAKGEPNGSVIVVTKMRTTPELPNQAKNFSPNPCGNAELAITNLNTSEQHVCVKAGPLAAVGPTEKIIVELRLNPQPDRKHRCAADEEVTGTPIDYRLAKRLGHVAVCARKILKSQLKKGDTVISGVFFSMPVPNGQVPVCPTGMEGRGILVGQNASRRAFCIKKSQV